MITFFDNFSRNNSFDKLFRRETNEIFYEKRVVFSFVLSSFNLMKQKNKEK